jgi:hypothetical protein
MRKNIVRIGLVAGLAAMLVTGAACKRDQQKKNYKGPFEGTAVQINPETSEVSMKMVHPEHGVSVTVKGYVNEKTQVEVNGVTARIEDIHLGDPVRVTGYYDGAVEPKRFVVTSITVHKADNNWIKVGEGTGASSAPATKPAQ